jgi:hypothetical protein
MGQGRYLPKRCEHIMEKRQEPTLERLREGTAVESRTPVVGYPDA